MGSDLFKLHSTEFEGLYIADFVRFEDHRGVLVKPWIAHELEEVFGSNTETYITSSNAGTMRGLHYQKGSVAQKKFVTCLSGKIEDVAVDMRRNSSTYGRVFNITINALDGRGVIIPEGFAHGFCSLSNNTILHYKCTNYRDKNSERGIFWNDPKLKIKWPIKKPILSIRDRKNLNFKKFIKNW